MRTGVFRKPETLGLLILAVVIGVVPLFVKSTYFLLVLNMVGLNTIVVLGLNLLIGYAGQISLGHGAFYGMGAYFSGVLTATYGISPWISMVIAMVCTGFIAWVIGIPTLKLKGHYLVMATLGFNIIVSILLVEWDVVTGGPNGLPGIPYLAIGDFTFNSDREFYYLIWLFTFGAIILSMNLVYSRVGRALRAIHGGETAAHTFGVDVRKYKVKVFVLSAVFASVAGSLYAHYITFISPKSFDFMYSIQVVVMVIVGGMGSIWGSLFGSIAMTLLSEALAVVGKYNIIAFGLILVLVLIFVPEGLVVRAVRFYQQRRVKSGPVGESLAS
jgi:branched-chain amino acid transport system permease protein